MQARQSHLKHAPGRAPHAARLLPALALLAACSNIGTPAGELQVGAGRREITPTPETAPPAGSVYLGGYGLGPERPSTGVLAPIYVRAFVVSGPEGTLAFAQNETQGAFAAYRSGPFGLRDVARAVVQRALESRLGWTGWLGGKSHVRQAVRQSTADCAGILSATGKTCGCATRCAVRRAAQHSWFYCVRRRCRIQQRRPRVQFTFAMAISQTEVRYIAELARLQLSEAELAEYALQLSAVLDYAASLNALDLAGVPPTASVLALHTVLRADEARPAMERDALLANAAETAAGCFRVPPVLE